MRRALPSNRDSGTAGGRRCRRLESWWCGQGLVAGLVLALSIGLASCSTLSGRGACSSCKGNGCRACAVDSQCGCEAGGCDETGTDCGPCTTCGGGWCNRWMTRRGCRPGLYLPMIDSWRVRLYARQRANWSWRRNYEPGSRGSCHFRDGFRQAYLDLAEGGDGTPPVVPPERYWNCYYRGTLGHAYVDEWFQGYHAGVEVARAEEFCPNPSIRMSESAWRVGVTEVDYAAGR